MLELHRELHLESSADLLPSLVQCSQYIALEDSYIAYT